MSEQLTPRETQLAQANAQLHQQLQSLMQNRANATILTVGEINDGLMFLLQAAANNDEQALTALKQLRMSLEKILKGDWNPPTSRIIRPR